ncbi:Y-family DNA polymerase [Emticicia sp. SJ17W-69]|uniref:Y-family DNA polymerase n=1 Tax=Emticicia sp. SJ17W-69 TaxID=3421657 RepID=UPI003EBC1420
MFALVDCNNFYASCQRVFQPNLIGKPIVVYSNNDGCVIARSNEAKALGVPMGAAAYQWEQFFKDNQIQVFSANFSLYGDMSQRVMTILNDFSPEMEIYSIDEAFIKFSGFERFNLQHIGETMYRRVTKGTGIPISVGIAPTKSLAKVANRIAKKFPQHTKNVYLIDNDEKRIKALKWLKIEDVWGIGRKHAKRLQAIGVKTAFDFTMLEDEWVKENMAIIGLRLKRDLEGNPTLDLEEAQPKKNIAITRSFEGNHSEKDFLQERISTFAVSCAEKLRLQKACCNSVMVFIQTNRHRVDLPQYNRNIVLNLPFPTNSSIEISNFALQALTIIFREGYQYKRAGVIVQDFTDEDKTQMNIFENSDERHKKLMQSIDKVNAIFGQQKIRLGTQDPKKIWKMKQENLSPNYTTKLSDIIVVHV